MIPFGYPFPTLHGRGRAPRPREELRAAHEMRSTLSALLVLVLTVTSGVMDARGFVYAGRAWPDGAIDWAAVGQSMLAFFAGISLYIVAVRFMQAMGLNAVALQSGIWFVATAIGIGALDGTIMQWSRLQQLVALGVIAGLAWLITTAHEAH
jgi:hypothetical protein